MSTSPATCPRCTGRSGNRADWCAACLGEVARRAGLASGRSRLRAVPPAPAPARTADELQQLVRIAEEALADIVGVAKDHHLFWVHGRAQTALDRIRRPRKR